jgi:hypothetical protein
MEIMFGFIVASLTVSGSFCRSIAQSRLYTILSGAVQGLKTRSILGEDDGQKLDEYRMHKIPSTEGAAQKVRTWTKPNDASHIVGPVPVAHSSSDQNLRAVT